jgi:hypothetical protein
MPQTNPLDETELAAAHEIVGLSDYTVSDISDLAALLTDGQLDLMRADIELWTPLRGKDLTLAGGRDGVSVDPERNRRLIRARTRSRLGIVGAASGGLFTIPVGGR